MAKRNAIEAGLGVWLDEQEQNKLLKVTTKTELEAKVASLELQLQASRQHAEFITTQRNELLMEKLDLMAAKVNLTTENAAYKDRCDRARLEMRDLFPEVREWLYKVVESNNWQNKDWPANFRETWNRLHELANLISNDSADSTDNEDESDEVDEEEDDMELADEAEI